MSPVEWLAWPFEVIDGLGWGGFVVILFFVLYHFFGKPTMSNSEGWPEWGVDKWEYHRRMERRKGRKS